MKNALVAFAGLALSASFALAQTAPAAQPSAVKPSDTITKPAETVKKDIKQAAELKLDIVDTAMADKELSTLVTAVKAAGLVEALKAKGPFTLFAPTNAAFDKLGKEKLDALMKDKDALAAVLKFHVIEGAVTGEQVAKMKESSQTLQGTRFMIASKDGKLMVGSEQKSMATVIGKEIKASNGIIHKIDGVMTPAEAKKETTRQTPKDAPKKDAPAAPATDAPKKSN